MGRKDAAAAATFERRSLLAPTREGGDYTGGPVLRSPRISLTAALAALLALLLDPASLVAAAPAASSLKQIRTLGDETGTVIEMWADGEISGYRHFSLPDPPRLVVDFPGLRSELSSHLISIDNGQVQRVRVGDHADKVRVVIEVEASAIAGARLARGDRGIALVLGDAEIPSFATRGAPQAATPRVVSAPLVGDGDASAQLSRAAQDLAAAARELSAAVRELRGARLAASPAPSELSTPPPIDDVAQIRAAEAAARDLEVAAREVERAWQEPSAVLPVAAGVGAAAAVAATPSEIVVAPPPTVSAPAPPTLPQVSAALPTPRPPVKGGAPNTVYPQTYAGVLQWIRENQGAVPRFAAGDVVRRAEISKLRPFMPPGYYEEFDFPDTRVTIQATASHAAHESYQQATLQYQGQTALGPDGTVLHYVAGKPFSEERIRGAEPRDGGLMAAWNNIFRWQHFGYRAGPIPMAYLAAGEEPRSAYADALTGGGRLERMLVIEYQRVYLSHQAALADQNYAVAVADAEIQHYKDWMQFTEPFDMRGTAFVIERFLDPHEPDQVNSYMPMERKVRRLSAKERTDSFLGSEMTMDDFEGFSGRVLDYRWKYLGEKAVLHVANSQNPHSVFFGPMSHVPDDRWQLRDCHVVEARPVIEGHPHARKITFYDKETYNIPMTLAFDAQDRLLKVIYTIYKWPEGSPAGDPTQTVSHYRSSVVINKQSQRSMVNWSEDTEIPEMKASKIRRLFNVSTLTGGR